MDNIFLLQILVCCLVNFGFGIIDAKPIHRFKPKKGWQYVRQVNFKASNATEYGITSTVSQQSPNLKIVGGDLADPGSWPWQVSLQLEYEAGYWSHYCGGSLIDNNWVLTAAHCVNNIENFPIRVVIGEQCFSEYSGWEQYVNPVGIMVHSYYQEETSHYDIALIKLTNEANLNSHVNTVSLATQWSNNDLCFISGWGKTIAEAVVLSDNLKEAQMHYMDGNSCRSRLGNSIIDSQVCVSNEDSSACMGDSGGPLVCQQTTGHWALLGVASWVERKDCDENNNCRDCELGSTNVYTQVSSYTDWIYYVMTNY